MWIACLSDAPWIDHALGVSSPGVDGPVCNFCTLPTDTVEISVSVRARALLVFLKPSVLAFVQDLTCM